MKKKRDEDGLRPSPQKRQEASLLNGEQLKKLVQTAQGHVLEALIIVAITTGLRSGELCGLRWPDVDGEDQRLHVCRTFSWLQRKEHRNTTTERIIALPRIAARAINLQRSHQHEARLKAGARWHDLDLVFPNPLGYYQDPISFRQSYHNLFTDAELSHIRFHDLRCSTAAFLLTNGVSVQVVQAILGYRWIASPLHRLTPLSLSRQQEAMKRWDELFEDTIPIVV
jgi:integrase